ncbi:hypothetical protein TWF106_004289 [Orbilia oligospora]|uniref:Uncharacterized protein n=1 Tax=Orbilia oligospora TaxID=2813651 RepID=A0A6G1MN57_ORBOL|nr:hypothetical protein TWF679_010230 [Orbilia oligospora]KAF3229370.1 hypothetical protein TWF106_004289 [Orbilia oligospora]KAF3264399.1 hypothetical protein TWF192_004085 [Orbilia oligospora]
MKIIAIIAALVAVAAASPVAEPSELQRPTVPILHPMLVSRLAEVLPAPAAMLPATTPDTHSVVVNTARLVLDGYSL